MFDSIDSAISDLKSGRMIIVVDDENRENEGDLVMAAEFCNPEDVNFMISHAKGLICVPMEEHTAMKLSLPLMVRRNEEAMHTNFTVSCDLREGITTGISSEDRSNTILKLSDELAVEQDFVSPGHIFPLIADPGGLETRPGHTEATIQLMKMCGLHPVGVICEIIREDGSMMRRDELMEYSVEHGLKIISIEGLMKELK
jgi:3,4-dihydroxy 2-butanone 4-phosphate synthase/GTP cyclohydrolase II